MAAPTGHIADIELRWNSPDTQLITVGPYYIPATIVDGIRSQDYVTGVTYVLVPPSEDLVITVPINNGFCAKQDVPAVPVDIPVADFDTWITPEQTGPFIQHTL